MTHPPPDPEGRQQPDDAQPCGFCGTPTGSSIEVQKTDGREIRTPLCGVCFQVLKSDTEQRGLILRKLKGIP